MVYFTEKLINEIHRRSCIWDPADVNHLNKEVLANMWMEIAENLYSDWHALSAFDQRDRVADVKKKWTNIKDSFVKDVKGKKPRKSRGPPEHRKKYYLFDHLQFLIPFIQDPKASGGGRRSAAGEAGESSRKRARKSVGEGSSRAHADPVEMATMMVTGKPEIPPDVQQHADVLNSFAGKSAADSMCQLDGDLSFMVSLLPTVKSLNEKQKINFKIGVLQLLARIKFNEVLQPAFTGPMDAYQPFTVTPDLSCFPVAYNNHRANVPFPFINHHAVSSTQQQQQQANQVAAMSSADRPSMKQEIVDSSPPNSSLVDTEPEDEPGDDSENNNY